jgi:hypothetical protein
MAPLLVPVKTVNGHGGIEFLGVEDGMIWRWGCATSDRAQLVTEHVTGSGARLQRIVVVSLGESDQGLGSQRRDTRV